MQDQPRQPQPVVPTSHEEHQNQHQISFGSIPYRLTLESKDYMLSEKMSAHSQSSFFDSSVLLQKYQLSYHNLRDYSHYLDYQLSRATTTKLILKQIISNYHASSGQQCLQAKEIYLLLFIINTIQYLKIQELIATFDLHSQHYRHQMEFKLPDRVVKLGEMFPMHLQTLEAKKRHYLQKFIKFNAIYRQQLKTRVSQLLKVFQNKQGTSPGFIQTLSSSNYQQFPSVQSLMKLYELYMKQIKPRNQQIISQKAEQKQLQSLYILEYLVRTHFLIDDSSYNTQDYLKQVRTELLNTEHRQMLAYIYQLQSGQQRVETSQPSSLTQ